MSEEPAPYIHIVPDASMPQGTLRFVNPDGSEHNFYLNLSANAASTTTVYPHIVPLNASAMWQPSMMTIAQYNELLSLYMKRGDVIRSAIHSLRARRDVAGTLSPCDEMLLTELEACE